MIGTGIILLLNTIPNGNSKIKINGNIYYCEDIKGNPETGLFHYNPDDQFCYFIERTEKILVLKKEDIAKIKESLDFYAEQHINDLKNYVDNNEDEEEVKNYEYNFELFQSYKGLGNLIQAQEDNN